MNEFEPRKKIKLGEKFYFKYIYILILGVVLILGTSYGLTFFTQNYKIGDAVFSVPGFSVTLSSNGINATGLTPKNDNEGLLEFIKTLDVTNDSTGYGEVTLKLERTSGLNLADLRYSVSVNNVIQKIGDVSSTGNIYKTIIYPQETLNFEIRLWPKSSYSGSETTFVGTLSADLKRVNMEANDYIKSTKVNDSKLVKSGNNYNYSSDSVNNYVFFNCIDNKDISTCEKWRIVGVQNDRLVLTRSIDYTNASERVDSLLFNTNLTFNDSSFIHSVSTDNKNVYLLKTVEISGGNGTNENPYVLSNNYSYVNDHPVIANITYKNNNTTVFTQPIYKDTTNYISGYIDNDVFLGWSTTDGGELTYHFGDSLNLTSNTNLYSVSMPSGKDMVIAAISAKQNAATNSCNPIYEEDGIKYFSGTNDCVDMNYVWYSGKLWRITAIYPDGTMKLVTQNNITTIAFGETSTFYDKSTGNKSYMFQWLNEDFLDTLYNYQNIIVTDSNTYWNTNSVNSVTNSYQYVSGTDDAGMIPTSIAPVGLLNKAEVSMDTNNNYTVRYLNNGYETYLLSKSSSTSLDGISYGGDIGRTHPSTSGGGNIPGVRPAVYLKNGIIFTGEGTVNNPYRITIDKSIGSTNDLVNRRVSGEYVSIDNNLFRIIGVENNTTKIISTTNLDSGYFSSTTFGEGTYNGVLDYRLNNSFYNNLTYKDKLTDGTYYIGTVDDLYNYKQSICTTATTDKTSLCTKTTSSTFKVALPRYGEMFATQQGNGYSSSQTMWLLTKYYNRYSKLLIIERTSYMYKGSYDDNYAAYPTMHLKNTVKIVSGQGLKNDPYVVE